MVVQTLQLKYCLLGTYVPAHKANRQPIQEHKLTSSLANYFPS